MQFILDSKLYDTATATTVAISRGLVEDPRGLPEGADSKRYEDVLYRTRAGNFFMHSHETVKFPRGKPVVADSARALTPQGAIDWIQQSGAMILDPAGLPLPEEA
jgi:hypothetical protein